MAATIRVRDVEATVANGVWACENKTIERVLNALTPLGGPSGADPNYDLTLAMAAVETLGGEVLDYDEQPADPDTIY